MNRHPISCSYHPNTSSPRVSLLQIAITTAFLPTVGKLQGKSSPNTRWASLLVSAQTAVLPRESCTTGKSEVVLFRDSREGVSAVTLFVIAAFLTAGR